MRNRNEEKMGHMDYYFAPLEGITWYVYRNAHQKFFPGITKYFAPFIVANQQDKFSARELNDLIPDHNQGLNLIPQVLTNKAEDFLFTLDKLKKMGYQEVNLNLGCPSNTVVAKHKGSGFLAKPEELNRFLDHLFMKTTMEISVKTRIGKTNPDEFEELLKIFNRYPLKELIIHPRIQKDFYKNTPNMEVFGAAVQASKNPICYNGDLTTNEDIGLFQEDFSQIKTVMIGRGLIRNPGMVNDYLNQQKTDFVKLKLFHDTVYEEYKEILSGDRNLLFRMKEIWIYLIDLFEENEKIMKKIRKTNTCDEYERVIEKIFLGNP